MANDNEYFVLTALERIAVALEQANARAAEEATTADLRHAERIRALEQFGRRMERLEVAVNRLAARV